MQSLRQHTVPHRHHHLDDSRHTRGSLCVTDVRLQRPQEEGAAVRPALPVRRQQRLRLDRVTQPGARAVSLHCVHLGGRDTGVGQGLADDSLLRGAVRSRQAVGRPVLVHRRTPDHRKDLMAVAPRVREPFEEQHADTL